MWEDDDAEQKCESGRPEPKARNRERSDDVGDVAENSRGGGNRLIRKRMVVGGWAGRGGILPALLCLCTEHSVGVVHC